MIRKHPPGFLLGRQQSLAPLKLGRKVGKFPRSKLMNRQRSAGLSSFRSRWAKWIDMKAQCITVPPNPSRLHLWLWRSFAIWPPSVAKGEKPTTNQPLGHDGYTLSIFGRSSHSFLWWEENFWKGHFSYSLVLGRKLLLKTIAYCLNSLLVL